MLDLPLSFESGQLGLELLAGLIKLYLPTDIVLQLEVAILVCLSQSHLLVLDALVVFVILVAVALRSLVVDFGKQVVPKLAGFAFYILLAAEFVKNHGL